MAPEALGRLAARLKLRYFASGETVLAPESGAVENLYIVQRGVVEGTPVAFPSFHATAVHLGEGESFPIGALTGQRPTTLHYVAAADTFCYLLPEADFRAAMAASPEFHAFCTQRLSRLLEQSAREVRATFAGRASAELGMQSTLAAALRRKPVTMPVGWSVREMLELMRSQHVGSVVITGEGGHPVGIFTHTDILARVALAGCNIEQPVATVMTPNPVSLPATSTVAEAAQLMARHGFRHILVMDGERLAGVLSERDLFALQRRSAQGLRKEIERAETPEWLAFAARDTTGLASSLLAQGVGAEPLLQLVTAMNDAIVARAVALADRAHGASALGFCWMGLGSEGRMEQTLATDQDNAIIFPEPPEGGREAARERLLAFAREVNATLAECGFPLCKGEIMASNPRWCLTLGEWRERFDDWMRNALPEALLHAAIFFDLRALTGAGDLVRQLQAFLLGNVGKRPAFLRQMAINALQTRPPLGFFNDIAGDPAMGGRLDLKLHATRPFVDVARILALSAGCAATSTVERLRQAGPHWRMGTDEIESAVQGFLFVQNLRLRRQEESRGGAFGSRNQVDPRTLLALDGRILKEALRQARKLQNRLALEYQL